MSLQIGSLIISDENYRSFVIKTESLSVVRETHELHIDAVDKKAIAEISFSLIFPDGDDFKTEYLDWLATNHSESFTLIDGYGKEYTNCRLRSSGGGFKPIGGTKQWQLDRFSCIHDDFDSTGVYDISGYDIDYYDGSDQILLKKEQSFSIENDRKSHTFSNLPIERSFRIIWVDTGRGTTFETLIKYWASKLFKEVTITTDGFGDFTGILNTRSISWSSPSNGKWESSTFKVRSDARFQAGDTGYLPSGSFLLTAYEESASGSMLVTAYEES